HELGGCRRRVGAPDHGGKKQPGGRRRSMCRRGICGENGNRRKPRRRCDQRTLIVNRTKPTSLAAKSARSRAERSVGFQLHRQESARVTGAAPVSGQDPPQIRVQATLCHLWAPTSGCASPSV